MSPLIVPELRRILTLLGNTAAIATGVVAIANAREHLFPNSLKPHRIYSAAEVARHLGVSVSEIEELIQRRELKGRKVGGRYLVMGTSVAEFLTK